MAQALFYSSNAVAMTLAAGIASGDTTCNLSSTSGLPASFPFKLLIGWQTAQQEVVHCTALSGVVATITRGQDGTTAQAHSIGASVVHGVSAREFNDLELHIGSTSGVHGIAGSLVGTTDTQTLTNKTLDTANNVLKISGNTLVAAAGSASVTVPNSTDVLVARNTTDTLTNKTFDQVLVSPAGSTSTAALLFNVNSVRKGSMTAPGAAGQFCSSSVVGDLVIRAESGSVWFSNNTGAALARIDSAGNITAANLTNAWTAYTPTFTNITSPACLAKYLLIGKTLILRFIFTGGTVTAAGTFSLTIPTGTVANSGGQAAVANIGASSAAVVFTSSSTALISPSQTLGTALNGTVGTATIELA